MKAYLIAVGFVSILGQVALLRELSVAFYGVELIYILAMGIWLLGTAAGAMVGRKRSAPSVGALMGLFLVFGLVLPLDMVTIRGARLLFGGIPGAYLSFGRQMAVLAVALLPVGILLGLLFQWAAKLYIGETRTLASAYALESVGGLAGGLAATLFFHLGIRNLAVGFVCSLMAVGTLMVPIRYGDRENAFKPGFHLSLFPRLAGLALLLVLSVALWFSSGIDNWTTLWNHPHLLDTRDSPYGRITVSGLSGQVVVFENDVMGFESESTSAEEFVHLVAIQRPAMERVLILRGGFEGTVREILKHRPLQVDYVELNPVLLELTRKHLPTELWEPLENEVVSIRTADPRRFLKNGGSYDVILSGMSEPSSGQANRFFTREFFTQCAERLRPTGVLGFRLRSAENLWTPLIAFRNTSVYLAVKSAFKYVVVLPGVTNTILASNSPLEHDSALLAERFRRSAIEARLMSPPYIRYLYTNDRFAGIVKRLETTPAVPNTDVRPVCYTYSSLIWLSKFVPELIHRRIPTIPSRNASSLFRFGILGLGVAGLFLLVRRFDAVRRAILVAWVGFAGMTVETMLLLYYQARQGILYRDIGLLLTGFMAGLAVGAAGVDKVLAHRSAGPKRRGIWTGVSLVIGFGILNLFFVFLLWTGSTIDVLSVAGLQFCTGALVAGIFAYASLEGVVDQRRIVSSLYASDLMGGCLGSITASLLLVPFLGMDQSAWIMAFLSLLALILVR
ncbi:MAG: hypothetical protein GY866_30665 [Proteobacteria bacterium]|nr:hypothetical protein [Pseudomonadota bacterium]